MFRLWLSFPFFSKCITLLFVLLFVTVVIQVVSWKDRMYFVPSDEITPHHILVQKSYNFVPPFSNQEFNIETIHRYNEFNNLRGLGNFSETDEKIKIHTENENLDDGDDEKKDKDEIQPRQFDQLKPSISKKYKKLTKPSINSTDSINWEIPEICNGRIDAVWLWVNGSDPQWLHQYKQYNNGIKPSYYRDYQTLLYSIRSGYMYAPGM
ncbi:hypothetical protein EDI_065980 [Entamoeba dispar SAW760]|uniref:Stealth protein CR1 conserved region 1 domain-containing protein n=1 Tax=Entamoeba dispar (strain ATCC PRA-260 / SAW760) TaxID=370354 RepID=B0EQT6_ENTDS|nr:uncharacterized protein EDI_065980 [Entamoeba dispar SAW760]EDR23111.1 hypothetical protein EDI_065980 [Entamoeba dispar SAW760]|eukprot:EDR23111.1 hypothetical protein EDI_065980 [Entamoeba dispar SAW760]